MKFFIYGIVIPVLCIVSFTTLDAQEKGKSITIEYAQLIVRDSEGSLVTYLETQRIREWSSNRIEDSINSDSTKIINSEKTVIDGVLYERIIFEKEPFLYPTESQRGVTILGSFRNGVTSIAATFMNDGHFQLPEDHVTVIWTALKSLE